MYVHIHHLTQMFFFPFHCPPSPFFKVFFSPTSPFQDTQSSCKHRLPVGRVECLRGLHSLLVLSDRQSPLCLTAPWVQLPGCTVVVPAWFFFAISHQGIRGMGSYTEGMVRSGLTVSKLMWGKGDVRAGRGGNVFASTKESFWTSWMCFSESSIFFLFVSELLRLLNNQLLCLCVLSIFSLWIYVAFSMNHSYRVGKKTERIYV